MDSNSANDAERQRVCNTIKGNVSCLLPYSGTENVESNKDKFDLFFLFQSHKNCC